MRARLSFIVPLIKHLIQVIYVLLGKTYQCLFTKQRSISSAAPVSWSKSRALILRNYEAQLCHLTATAFFSE